MTARREPSSPPAIPGFEPVRLLGMGGFADVFLYQQSMPRRQVAVKVLLAGHLGDEVRERFRAEADVMASLSHHPSIVTIYHADVASDGRPYLVMEYCSRPGLGQRYRNERMGVAEVLRIGIRLASAVETAHRAGVLHRDIKPANVLITDFGWPALTDFGIAATTGWSSDAAVGMSIPWSPPELLGEHPTGDTRGDVYSLAATVYSLLARRSPFEVPGGSNTAADLIARIERGALQQVGRGDVPDSLHGVLARAMDRDPEVRHHSALAFARALQQVEAELLLPLTPLDLNEEPPVLTSEVDEDTESGQATRLRPVQSVSPDAPSAPPAAGAAPVAGGVPVAGAPGVTGTPTGPAGIPGPAPQFPRADDGAHEPDGVPAAWRRQVEAQAPAPAVPERRRRRPGAVLAGVVAGVVLVAALAGGAFLAFRPDAGTPEPTATATSTLPAVRAVPAPEELAGTAGDGSVTFTWENPEPEDGDTYLWGRWAPGEQTQREIVEEPTVTVPAEPGERVCIEVAVVRTDGRYSTTPATGCVDA